MKDINKRKTGRKRLTLGKVNTVLASAVVVLALVSIYSARNQAPTVVSKTIEIPGMASSTGAHQGLPPSAKLNPVPKGTESTDKSGTEHHTYSGPQKAVTSAKASKSNSVKTDETKARTTTGNKTNAGNAVLAKSAASNKSNKAAASKESKTAKPAEPSPVSDKTVYLTFDDGPSPYTDQILDILDKQNIHATFFLIGSQLEDHQGQINRLLKEGHYPGLHSMSHSYKKLYKSGSSAHFINEFKQEQALFKELTGEDVDLIRAPYGSAPQIGKSFRDDIADAGFKMWDWTVDSKDWSYTGEPDKVIHQVKRQVHGKLNVILMHEKKQTVQALPQIITYLREQGYSFAVYKPDHHLVVNFAKDDRL
ncbi:polysaccharide deacetylase family protein [Paenibacillus caui]|uniref:polysaccharide deacetylase family protein n=1 Tax=Paenibacillus caui TaxID=2873927 RepID=UPI001F3719C3|nr:polysaccharide deacetylase family protein [Paenibacillus caui]